MYWAVLFFRHIFFNCRRRPHCGATFFHSKSNQIILTKSGLGHILGVFVFTRSPGHTVSCFQAELEVLLTAAAFTENDFQLLRECRPVALWHRVASWFNFRLKIGIWVHFGESCNVCMYVCMCILWTWSSILQPFDIFYACLLYFVVIRYIFPRFGILHQDKSGSPALPTNYLAPAVALAVTEFPPFSATLNYSLQFYSAGEPRCSEIVVFLFLEC
jgi:hypothetical protein